MFTFAGLGFRFVVGLVAIVLVSVFGVGCVGCGFWFYVGWVCLFAEAVWWFWELLCVVLGGGLAVRWLIFGCQVFGWWCLVLIGWCWVVVFFVTYAGGVGWVLCGCVLLWLGFADDVVAWWFIVDFCCVWLLSLAGCVD